MVLNENRDWPRVRYDSRINNVATEFFIPALKNSTTYRRIGGFFSSTSLALAARGIGELVANGGKMQLIVNPILTTEDAATIRSVSEGEMDEMIHKSLVRRLDLGIEFERNHVAALGYLLRNGFLEMRVELQTDQTGSVLDYNSIIQKGMLDEKLGIFQDRDGNAMSFRGPINENRQSWERGTFDITVDAGWIEGQRQHVLDDINRFEERWNSTETVHLPDITKLHLVENGVDKTRLDLEKFNVPDWAMLPDGGVLWPHQIRAVNSWKNANHHGIMSMATGGGKTLSALVAAGIVPTESIILILVPTKILILQWEKEILRFCPNADLTVCDGSHRGWNDILSGKLSVYVGSQTVDRKRHLIILSTIQTAISEKFMGNFDGIRSEFITMIADEVHHLGALEFRKVFGIRAQRRLGLSATFERDWDEDGTSKILQYFGKQFEETYTVADGIRDGKLSRYCYFPCFAYLSNSEFIEYSKYSKKIKSLAAQIRTSKNPVQRTNFEEKCRTLLMKRSEIIKKADDKIRAYGEILKRHPKKPYIVFADDHKHVEKLRKKHKETIQMLNRKNPDDSQKDKIMTVSGRYSDKVREIALAEAKNHQTPLFAMYCLDEGVDIPEFQAAIIVSSSTSRRQYIQRRGRILRTGKKNHTVQLYDIIVLPSAACYDDNKDDAQSIICREKNRVIELAADAVNKWEVDGILDKKLKDLGFLQ